MTQARRGGYVLIIDDEEAQRVLLVRALTRRGCEALAAEDGLRGLAAARARPPDVVLSDVNMPGLDGMGVLMFLRRELPGTPVILTTGLPSAKDAARAAGLGAFAYLAKPYDLDALLALVERALGAGPRSS